jgi:PAS domain S-box-containing protein
VSDFIDITERSNEKIKILIIDDDEVDQLAIKRSLKSSNMFAEVSTSNSASEGLSLLQSNKFDCIFVDFKLPEMDGLELLDKIVSLNIQTPVLIVTSHGDERIAAEAIRLGAADYIPKSLLTPEGVYHSIRNALRLQHIKQERQKAEDKLRSTQNQLDLIISNSPMAFWNVDKDGVIQFARGMAYERIGLSPDNLIGKNIREAFKNFPRIVNKFKNALEGELVQSMDESNGLYFKSHYVPIYDENGSVAGVTGFAIDVTDRINNERELIKAKEIAENSVKVKEQFLANISHEIRTPMNGIIGLTNVLKKTNLAVEQQKYLNAIHKSADNLMVIINDLLDFSKITAEQFTFEQVEFSLAEQLSDVLELMDSKAEEHNDTLTLEISPAVPTRLIGDPLRLRQVFLNLIGNAIKFTESGTIKISVNILKDRPEEVVLEFSVEDNGIGIPAEKLHNIFESFNQGSNDTTRKYGGTGLGLTISKNIIELQGGTIAVRSQPNVGSKFSFTLSFKKLIEMISQNEPLPQPEKFNTENLKGLKVLLAEDNEINQLLIKTVLSDCQINTDVVGNGLEALKQFQQNKYDLILMDMQMPEMDGYEAIDKIRSLNSSSALVPIVALTAHASEEEIAKCLAAGADAYVSKPFEVDDLYHTIYRLTSKSASYNVTVDLRILEDMAGSNKEFLNEILAMYIQSIPESIEELTNLHEIGDYIGLKNSISELLDSINIISAYPLQNSLDKVLKTLQDNPYADKTLNQQLNKIFTECVEVVKLLKHQKSTT